MIKITSDEILSPQTLLREGERERERERERVRFKCVFATMSEYLLP